MCRRNTDNEKKESVRKEAFIMSVVISGRELKGGLRLSELQKEDIVFMVTHDHESYITVSILNAWYEFNGKRYTGYAECRFKKDAPNDGVLVAVYCLYGRAMGNAHWLPRKQWQDERYQGSRAFLQEVLGDPSEETDTYFRYDFEKGYVLCEQILSGPNMYQGAWIEIHFTNDGKEPD